MEPKQSGQPRALLQASSTKQSCNLQLREFDLGRKISTKSIVMNPDPLCEDPNDSWIVSVHYISWGKKLF